MRRWVSRVQLDRATELPLGLGPVPVEHEERPRERCVRLRERVIELDRLASVYLGGLEALDHGHAAVVHMQRITVRQPRVGECITRILGDRLLEEPNAGGDAFLRTLVPLEAAL